MRKKRNKLLFRLTVCVLSVLTTTSCSKDEFFKIEDTPCIDSQTIYEIATSELYVDYQKARFAFFNEISNIDSTKIGHIRIIDGDTIFESGYTFSFGIIYELHDSLMKEYPELKDADQVDLALIQDVAISNNSALKEMAPKSVISSLNKTKASYADNLALQWCENNAHNLNGSMWVARASGEGWLVPTDEGNVPAPNRLYFECIHCVTIDIAMELACIWSQNHGEEEVGGLGWNDNSAVMLYCENLSTTGWAAFYPAWATNPLPDLDFHVHPSGDLNPSTLDAQAWLHMPWIPHYIISYNHEMQMWQYE